MKKTVLVTAFEPFGGDMINPTRLILERLPGSICGAEIKKLLLPVEFIRAGTLAVYEAARLRPDAVVCLGQAGGRSAVTPELTAYNLADARIPDNAGRQPSGEPIEPGGPESVDSRLPVWDVIAHIRALGLPAQISFSAGRYVCNDLMYRVLRGVDGSIPAGFIHVPFMREQVEGVPERENAPFMESEDMQRAVEAAIEAVVRRING